MKRLLSAASVLALAGVAQAAPFSATGYQAGGGLAGIAGAGFTASSFFDAAPTGNVLPTGAANFTAANFNEFDSYFGLDPFGPSAKGRSSNVGDNSIMTRNFYGNYAAAGAAAANYNTNGGTTVTLGPGSHIGDPNDGGNPGTPENRARVGIGVSGGPSSNSGTQGYPVYTAPPVPSGFAPRATGGRSLLDGIFVGRLTIHSNDTLTGGLDFTVLISQGVDETHSLVLGGPGVTFNTQSGPQSLALVGYKVGSVNITVTGQADLAGLDDGTNFGQADVIDLWVQVVPTPGALALLGLGGLTTLRRRRA